MPFQASTQSTLKSKKKFTTRIFFSLFESCCVAERKQTMFRFVVRRAFATKTSTGIVGLEVEPNAHLLLKKVYEETVRKCAPMPDSFLYKTNLVRFAQTRLQILNETSDHAQIEARFDDGKVIEEVLEHAKDELELIDELIAAKGWAKVDPYVEVIQLPEGVHHVDRVELVRPEKK
jgi:hypothetical protein